LSFNNCCSNKKLIQEVFLGQKTNPIGLRVGIIRGWDSNWYESKVMQLNLKEDDKLRGYVRNRLKKAGISRIVIDRTSKNIILTIHTSRPGVVIGKERKRNYSA
jgi:small subunit ribosomal protein S3